MTTQEPLCRIFRRSPDAVVAYGGDEPIRVGQLLRRAAAVAASLPALEEGSGPVLCVFESDRAQLLAALLAVWSRGQTALIPPDTRRATLTQLHDRTDVSVVLHDTRSGLGVRATDAEIEAQGLVERLERVFSTDAVLVELGGARLDGIALGRELSRIETLADWSVKVSSEVSVGHRFGLVAGLLAPAALGGQFSVEVGPYGGASETADAELRVTVPYYLSRSARMVPTLCSTGPLTEKRPEVTDVLSVSAAGVVAARSDPETPFVPLPGVALSVGPDGMLVVDEGGSSFVTHDAAVSETAGIRLRPRADRSCGELSLDAVEQELLRLEGVLDVAVTRLEPEGAPAFAAALVECAPEAWAEVRARVQAELPAEVRGYVAARPVPRDDLGRVRTASAWARMGFGPRGEPRTAEAEISGVEASEEGWTMKVSIPEGYRWFDGHFTGYPVLPAAVILHRIVVPCLREVRLSGALRRIDRLKLNQRILPGSEIDVTLVRGKPGEVRFELKSGTTPMVGGRAVLDGEAGDGS